MSKREGERERESRSRIVVVVHPIMRLARYFRSRAANNPFSTWGALIIVGRQKKRWKERQRKKQKKGIQKVNERGTGWSGVGVGRRPLVGEGKMPFYFFQKLIEIARDYLLIDLYRDRTNQINQREWSRNEFEIIILSDRGKAAWWVPPRPSDRKSNRGIDFRTD